VKRLIAYGSALAVVFLLITSCHKNEDTPQTTSGISISPSGTIIGTGSQPTTPTTTTTSDQQQPGTPPTHPTGPTTPNNTTTPLPNSDVKPTGGSTGSTTSGSSGGTTTPPPPSTTGTGGTTPPTSGGCGFGDCAPSAACACKGQVDIPIAFQYQSCPAGSSVGTAVQAFPNAIMGYNGGPTLSCGQSGTATVGASIVSCAPCQFHPGVVVSVQARVGIPGQVPDIGDVKCAPFPISFPLDQNTFPSCKPTFTITGDRTAGTLACSVTCTP
jgi:hypothetical protein